MEAVWLTVLESVACISSTWPPQRQWLHVPGCPPSPSQGQHPPGCSLHSTGLVASILSPAEICLAGLYGDQHLSSQKLQGHLLLWTSKGAFAQKNKIWGWRGNLSQNSKEFTYLRGVLGNNPSSTTNSPHVLVTPESSELLRSLNTIQVGYVTFIT